MSVAAACLFAIAGVAGYLLLSASPVQAFALVRSRKRHLIRILIVNT